MNPGALVRWTRWSVTLGVALRVALALVNGEANDDHMPVIRTIAFEHRFPAVKEQWESFQPKLFHTTVAVVLQLFDVNSPAIQIRVAQMIACIAGLLTLVVAIRFFRNSSLSPPAQAGAIAFVSLNPALIGINAQATNDSFVILFGTIALTSGVTFFRERRNRDFAAMTAAALASGLSKGNGLVTIIAILLVLAATVVLRTPSPPGSSRVRMSWYLVAFAILVVPAVWLLTPLHTNFRDAGTPFVTNWSATPRAQPLQVTVDASFRPGLLNIIGGLMTFRFVDMLRHPYIIHGHDLFYASRTSLWSQIYGRTFFEHFSTYPPSWMSIHPLIQALGRVQLILGLFPAILLVLGLAGASDRGWALVRRAAALGPWFDPSASYLVITAFGYLAFAAAYAVKIRDFSVMNSIFIFPAITAFTLIAAAEYDTVIAPRTRSAAWARWLERSYGVLLVGFAADVTWIIVQLAMRNIS